MAQFLRPDSNVTQTSFTNGFANIDESAASDADFAYGANNTAAVLEVGLSNPGGTPASGTTTVRYRVAKTNNGTVDGGGATVTVTCSVRQGANVIATDTARTATGTWTQYSFTPSMAGVTDWNDVRLRFTTSASGGTTANRRGGAVSWAELEAPDAQSGVSGSMAATESGDDTFSATGTVSDPAVTGTMAATESGSDTASAGGSVAISGSLSAAEAGSDISSATGQIALTGNLAGSEAGSDGASASGSVGVSGSLVANEVGEDSFAGSGSVEGGDISGSMNASEAGDDTASFSGMALLFALLDAAETESDTAECFAEALVSGTLAGDDPGPDLFYTAHAYICRRTAKRPGTGRVSTIIRQRNISRGTR